MIKSWFITLGVLFVLCWVVILGIYFYVMMRHKIKNIRDAKKDKGTNANETLINNNVKIITPQENPKENNINNQINQDQISNLFNQLQEDIKVYISQSNNFPLLTIGSMIGLDADEIIGNNSNFDSKFIECSKQLLNYQRFKIITNSRIASGIYQFSDLNSIDLYHQILCKVYVEKFNNFLTEFKDYFDFIEQNKELLASKKRIYLKEDEFGDIDGSEWIHYLQRFAIKRELHKESDYPDDLEAVENYIALIKLDFFEGKVISYLLALWEHFEKKENKFASVYTGVDFELYLKAVVEEKLEGSYVETTPASGDHGADLIIRFKGISIAVQAKYYTGAVGNAAVQEIHSGMGFYDADYGMVVTQSKYTEHAKSLATKLGVHLENVETFIDKVKTLAG